MPGMITPIGHSGYPQPCDPTGPKTATLGERLAAEREQLEVRLDKIKAIQDALQSSPETGKILDLISELGGF